jgi:hypothetical protein
MKTISIILIGLVCLSFVGGYFLNNKLIQDDEIDLDNFKISSNNLKTLTDTIPNDYYYRVCSLKKEDSDTPCVIMLKRELE